MNAFQTPRKSFVFALGMWLALLAAVSAAAPTKEEIAKTAKWFDGLEWPDLRGKPYVEIVFGQVQREVLLPGKKQGEVKWIDGPTVRGFLLAQDKQFSTVFLDGVVSHQYPGYDPRRALPFVVQRFQSSLEDTDPVHEVVMRRIDLPAAVHEAIAAAHEPKENELVRWAGHGLPKFSQMVALFCLARWCSRAGHADSAELLDAELPKLKEVRLWQPGAASMPFRTVVENEIAHTFFLAAKNDCAEVEVRNLSDQPVPRAVLQTEFAPIARDFPDSADHAEAAHAADILQQMVAEDAKHAPVGWQELKKMSEEGQARELIFELRDQVYVRSYACDPHPLAPVEELADLGYAVVPALIGTLGDPRLTRSVGGFHWDPEPGSIITFGDCAVDALSRISNRTFGFNEKEARMGRAAPWVRSERPEQQRKEIEAWWKGVQTKGERASLIESVRAGDDDSPQKAARLAEIDPAAMVEALTAGMDATKNDAACEGLIRQLLRIKSDAATGALRREMQQGKNLQCRVWSAQELIARGATDVVPAMVAELQRRPKRRHYDSGLWPGDLDPLIAFLGSCGDLAAMKALAARLPQLNPDLRGLVIESLLPKEPPPKAIPADVEALAEKMTVAALDDRALAFEPWPPEAGNSGGFAPEAGGKRVCDIAAEVLARRWPDRYPLKKAPAASTRLERDAQYAELRNAWRVTRGLKPLPAPEWASALAAHDNANVVAKIHWISGGPVVAAARKGSHPANANDPFATDPKGKLPIKAGQPLTGKAFVAAAEQLQNAFADEWLGVTVSAERLGDGRGMVVEIEPLGRRQARVKHAMLELLPTMEMDLQATVGGKPAGDWNDKDFGGGRSYFQDEKHMAGIDKALEANDATSVGIYFQSVVGQ